MTGLGSLDMPGAAGWYLPMPGQLRDGRCIYRRVSNPKVSHAKSHHTSETAEEDDSCFNSFYLYYTAWHGRSSSGGRWFLGMRLPPVGQQGSEVIMYADSAADAPDLVRTPWMVFRVRHGWVESRVRQSIQLSR